MSATTDLAIRPSFGSRLPGTQNQSAASISTKLTRGLELYRPDGIVFRLPNMKKTTQDPASVRTRLLNAAEQVAARDGVASLTIDAVAREAGVSKGGLLYHFRTKSDLINAVVERLATHCETEQCRSVQEGPLEPGAFTRAYLRCRSEPLDPQELPFHMALLAAAGTDSQYLDPFRQRTIGWQARIESDGIDPVIATIVRLAIDGMCFSTLLGLPVPEGELREKILKRLEQMTEVPAEKPKAVAAAATK